MLPDTLKAIVETISKTYLFPLCITIVFWVTRLNPSLVDGTELSKNTWWILTGYICTVYTLLYPVSKLWVPIKDWFSARKQQKEALAKVDHILETIKNQLTEQEKVILRYYVNENVRAYYFRLSNGAVGHLCNLGILYRASTISRGGDQFSFAIQDFVLDFLKKNPGVLN